MSSRPRRHSLSPVVWVLLLGGAIAWRLWLRPQFFGWEESDYGNLAMARGVLESGFAQFDMNHLPLYYGLSAAVMAVVGDAELATFTVSFCAGIVAFSIAVHLSTRLFGMASGLATGAFLLLQPEMALYSVTALREPLYAALLLASTLALTKEHLKTASLFAGLAFLVRMDALFVLAPVLAYAAFRVSGSGLQRASRALGPLLCVVFSWMAYCKAVHGTWQFWAHSVAVNVETGGVSNVGGALDAIAQGLSIAWGLSSQILPAHLSWPLFLFGLAAFPALIRSTDRRVRLTLLTTFLLTGFWLAIGLVGQHEVGHNLYWKWLLPIVPYWAIGGGVVAARVGERLLSSAGAGLTVLVGAGLIAGTAFQQLEETHRQIDGSVELYKPQLDLARQIERQISEDEVLLVDNIPGCWLNRRANNRKLWSWMDVPVQGDALGPWLSQQEIRYVLWFRESWTEAPRVAPTLAHGGRLQLGPVTLIELSREDRYGWIWYRVEASPSG